MNKGKLHQERYFNNDIDSRPHYENIMNEIERLGITQQKLAEMLGVSRGGLIHRIKTENQTLHWALLGVTNYLRQKPKYESVKL